MTRAILLAYLGQTWASRVVVPEGMIEQIRAALAEFPDVQIGPGPYGWAWFYDPSGELVAVASCWEWLG